jgi:hypothetical protein
MFVGLYEMICLTGMYVCFCMCVCTYILPVFILVHALVRCWAVRDDIQDLLFSMRDCVLHPAS